MSWVEWSVLLGVSDGKGNSQVISDSRHGDMCRREVRTLVDSPVDHALLNN